jgi:hypothetical protein
LTSPPSQPHWRDMDISNLNPQQLRKAADLQEKVLELQNELKQLLGAPDETAALAATQAPAKPKNGRKKRRKLSPQAITNIRAGVAKRMGKKGALAAPFELEQPAEKPKRKVSAARRKALSLAAKARWAQARAAGKTRL